MKPGTYCLPCGEESRPTPAVGEFDGDPMCAGHAMSSGFIVPPVPGRSVVPAVQAARDRESRKEERRDLATSVDFFSKPATTSAGPLCKKCRQPVHRGRRCDGTTWERGGGRAPAEKALKVDKRFNNLPAPADPDAAKVGQVLPRGCEVRGTGLTVEALGPVSAANRFTPETEERCEHDFPIDRCPGSKANVSDHPPHQEAEFGRVPLAAVPALPKYTAGGGRMGRFWTALAALPPGEALVLKETSVKTAGSFISSLKGKARDMKREVEYRRDGGTVYAWLKMR